MKSWKKLSSSIVHKNPWYRVRKDQVTRPDGSPGEYYIVETNGASVFAVVVNEKKQILLVNQERYTTGLSSWEIPGGSSDGQDPQMAVKRELMEETGIKAQKWELVGTSYVMNGVSNEKSYMFKATELTFHKENKQQEEGITQTKWATLQEIKQMIKSEEITDNQTITAITKAFLLH